MLGVGLVTNFSTARDFAKMGASSSQQFRQALQRGDEDAALFLYHSHPDLRGLNPTKCYGVIRKTTLLHYSVKRGFFQLFKEFLVNGANPNAENYKKQSVVHEICITTQRGDQTITETRAEMLQFLINFCTDPIKACPDAPGPLSPQLLNLNKQDSAFNTPLHLATASGLLKCVEIFLFHGAQVHILNIAGQTPFDCARVAHHEDIMSLLEPKMVFSHSKDSDLLKLKPDTLRQESYQGMQEQDLQKIKDTLVLQMSSLLGVSLSNATALLHAFGWAQGLLISAWFEDPKAACDQAKIQLPIGHQTSLTEGGTSRQVSIEERDCEICIEPITEVTSIPCGHNFCKTCWKEYLEMKIGEGKVVQLQCPGFDCNKLVPLDVITEIIPKEVDAKYIKFGIDAFVDASPNLKWCPHPGCGRAVCLPSAEAETEDIDGEAGAQKGSNPQSSGESPRAVDCGKGHFFCWNCGAEAHDPCNCDLWVQWKDEVSKQDESNFLASATTTAQQSSSDVWITKHAKPCPNCHSPIQKNDGCNQMTCSKCDHKFCWVCLGSWRIHGSRTGGYYECNRFRATRNAKKRLEKNKETASNKAKKQHTKYFRHVYNRYLNHTQSLKYEEDLLGSAKEKAAALMAAVLGQSASVSPEEVDGKFVEDAVRELLKARLVLRSSYALSYFLSSDLTRNCMIKLLAPLERSTEMLAEMIARPHLCTPKDKIVLSTVESREVRRKFLPSARQLNPQKTPDTLDLEDEDLDPVDPNNPDLDLSDLDLSSDSFDTSDPDDDWDDDDDDDSDWDD